jgi:colanic acid biosynthesis glycosyl transferase WcaI
VRILFLNQYFPPDPAPTGILLKEVADALVEAGHEIIFASAGQDYRAGQQKGSRMKRELSGLWRIWKTGLSAGKIDVVVSATSPPLLVVVGAMIAKLRGARYCHWLFDMYPQLATALGEISNGPPAMIFRMATRWAYRSADCVVALDDDMAAMLKRWGAKTRIIPPWIFGTLLEARAKALKAVFAEEKAMARGEPVTMRTEPVWLYSGNLGRAHEWRTLLDAQKLLEASGTNWRLVFQGGGPAWPAAQAYAKELALTKCDWRPYMPEGELPASLLAATVLVITQRPETCGLLWPSKLALAMSLCRIISPSPVAWHMREMGVHMAMCQGILWIGPVDRAIARTLKKAGGSGVFPPGDAEGVAKWVQTGEGGGDEELGERTDPRATRDAGIAEWVEIITGSTAPPEPAVAGKP